MLRKGDELIPGYRLEEFLGRGQFGEVWRTTAPGGALAALKFINLGRTAGLKEFRGVRRVKEIRHAHLMPITALWMLDDEGAILSDRVIESYSPEQSGARTTLAPLFQTDDSPQPEWLVVAMLLGDKNLMDRLEEFSAAGDSAIPLDELLVYMEEAAKGVDFLNSPQHDLGEGLVSIQHCDIKPANIMLVGDSVLICDFGLARMLGDAAATATSMVGSPAYMAPECINRRPSHASDQYSLAITYFELRTGGLPFVEENYMAILDAHRTGNLDLSRLPAGERDVIRKATAVDPNDRYPTALDMVHALQDTIQPHAPPTNPVFFPLAIGFAAVVLCMLGALVGWITLYGDGDEPGPGRNGGVTPAEKAEYTLTFDPPEANVTINGESQTLSDAGEVKIELADDDAIELQVWYTDDYQRIDRSQSVDQLKLEDFHFVLPRSFRFYVDDAWKKLAAGDTDGAVEAYRSAIRINTSLASSKPMVLRRHTKAVRCLEISQDGRWLISASDDGTACVWRLRDKDPGSTPTVLRGHEEGEPIESLDISSDGRWAVTGSWDNMACLWDLESRQPEEEPVVLKGHDEDVLAVRITPDGRWIVTASFDTTVRLWDLRSQTPDQDSLVLRAHSCEIERIAVSPDSRWLVTIDADGNANLWDLRAGDPSSEPHPLSKLPHRVKACKIMPDNRWLVTGGDDGSVVFSDMEQEGKLLSLAAAGDAVEALAVDEEGKRLLAGAADGTARFWLLESPGKSAGAIPLDRHGAPVVAVEFGPGGTWGVTGSWDKAVFLWNLGSKQPTAAPLQLTGHAAPILAICISSDGRWLATADQNGVILLWHLPQCEVIQRAAEGLNLGSAPRVEA